MLARRRCPVATAPLMSPPQPARNAAVSLVYSCGPAGGGGWVMARVLSAFSSLLAFRCCARRAVSWACWVREAGREGRGRVRIGLWCSQIMLLCLEGGGLCCKVPQRGLERVGAWFVAPWLDGRRGKLGTLGPARRSSRVSAGHCNKAGCIPASASRT